MTGVAVDPEVADAIADGRGVVALESTIISHGLPRPDNLRIAREIEDAVRSSGAVPATIALVDGIARIGLDDDALSRVAGDDSVVKVSVRDLAAVACLSPDRLTHLFAEQVGVSVKRYALWTKVRRTVQQFTGQRSLTDVALVSGFTDAAHMSRTFQRYFGLPPSFLASQVRVTADEQASHAWGQNAPLH